MLRPAACDRCGRFAESLFTLYEVPDAWLGLVPAFCRSCFDFERGEVDVPTCFEERWL